MDAAKLQRLARQQIDTERLLGIDAVPVSAGAVSAPDTAAPSHIVTQPVVSESAQSRAKSSPESIAESPPTTPVGAPSALFTSPPTPLPQLERSRKIELLGAMNTAEVSDCRKCRLCERRTHTVFGEGNPDAKVMFVGEGPGENEDLQGRPFVGRAGELLDKQIVAMGFKREDVYIANVVKCRPPENRPPQPDEVAACWGYLRRQIETIAPRAIVTLGGPATKQLLQTVKGITAIRGLWHVVPHLGSPAVQMPPGAPPSGGIPVMPTFHPAYLLRAYTPDNRRKVWEDLKKVIEFVQ